MYFKRKAYDELLKWKKNYADRYAVLLEGARRVGKSTIAETFARNEYDTYILIDFAEAGEAIRDCFDDIANLNIFFLRLQAETGVTLHVHKSVIIFDEVQLFPKARQAIKYLVKDGRYHYIETGSLISIRKNVKDILIPSEEMKIPVYPMDYEEFCRIYMAVGGMPQAVEAFTEGRNFAEIDQVKRQIIGLYQDDFKKIDPSGRISAMYQSIPAQLSKDQNRYRISAAAGRKSSRDAELLYDLVDSKTVLISYNTTDPRVSLSLTKDPESYKLYLSDTGLFVTLMFMDRPAVENELYAKLLSDKLPANLGYLYENLVAQMLASAGRELYYHTWEKENSTHYYEIDFLISEGTKISAIEVKSSGVGKHESITEFKKRFSGNVKDCYLLSQKDTGIDGDLKMKPLYLTPFLL